MILRRLWNPPKRVARCVSSLAIMSRIGLTKDIAQKRTIDDMKANGKASSRDVSPVQSTSKGKPKFRLLDTQDVLTCCLRNSSKRQEAQVGSGSLELESDVFVGVRLYPIAIVGDSATSVVLWLVEGCGCALYILCHQSCPGYTLLF